MKFELGQKVKAPDGEIGEIVSIRIDASGVHYVMTSKEVDLQAKEILHGVKHLEEDELEAVDDIEAALDEAPSEEEAPSE